MPKPLKKSYILIPILLGIVVFPVFCAVFFIKTGYGQQYILAKLNESIPGRISWQAFNFSLLRGRFQWHDFEIEDHEGKEIAVCKRLFFDMSWSPLVNRELYINTLMLVSPRIMIQVDKEGKQNLIQALVDSDRDMKNQKEDPDQAPPFNIIIKSLQLRNGSVGYEQPEAFAVQIHGVEISAGGNLLDKQATLSANTGNGRFEFPDFQFCVDSSKIDMGLSDGRLEPSTVMVSTPYADLTLSGNIDDLFNRPSINLTLDLEIMLSELKQSFSLSQDFTGKIAGQIAVKGQAENPEVSTQLCYSGGNLSTYNVDQFDFQALMKDRRLFIKTLQAKLGQGDLEITGDADLNPVFPRGFLSSKADMDALSYRLVLHQRDVPLNRLFNKDLGIKGEVTADYKITGTGIDPKQLEADFDVEMLTQNVSFCHAPISVDASLKAKGTMKKGVGAISFLTVKIQDTALNANGSFDLKSKNIDAKLTLAAPDVSQTLSSFGIRGAYGELSMAADISGTYDNRNIPLKGAVSFKAKNTGLNKMKIGDLTAGLRLSDQKLYIDRLCLNNGRSALTASGAIELFGQNGFNLIQNPEFVLAIDGESVYLEDFTELLRGNVALKSRVEGKIKNPEGFVKLKGGNWDLGVQRITEIKAHAKLDGEKIDLKKLSVSLSHDDKITGTGWLSMEKEFGFSLFSSTINLDSIDLIKQLDIAKGKGRFDVSGKGKLPDVVINGEVLLHDLSVQKRVVDDVKINIEVKNQSAKLWADILGAELDGSFHLQRKDFTTSLAFNEADLGPYFKLTGRSDFSGIVNGTFNASGNIKTIDEVEVSADLSGLDLFYKRQPLLCSKKFIASLKDKRLSIPGAHFTVLQRQGDKEGRFDIKGEGALDGELAFEINGRLPLQLVELFTEDVQDVKGDLAVSASIGGTMAKPDLKADLGLENIGFKILEFYQKVHQINGRIKITPGEIDVEQVSGMLDTGRYDLEGKIKLEAFEPSDIFVKLRANTMPIKIPGTLELLVDTDLTVQGAPESTSLTGELVLLEGLYYKDININLSLLQEIGKKRRKEKPLRGDITLPFLKNMALDVYIKHKEPFVVDNNLAQLDIAPDLRIEGSLNHPLLKGRTNVESGTVTYQRKTFVVDRGMIDFLNPQKIEPTVDIRSHAEITQYRVELEVTGTPEELIFKLNGWNKYTNYRLNNEDVLSLILFGKTSGDLISGEGGSSQSASQMMAMLITSTFGEEIKKATGLDILELESSDGSDRDDPHSTKVTVGKELSRRLALKYAWETKGDQRNQQAIAEYKFLEYILLNGFQSTDGNFGTELQFRLEFR